MDKTLRNFDKIKFINNLTTWYEKNKRDLPWRKTNNPYYIWISEIMLQQTKVDTVIDYYNRFIEMYPTVFHLAEAEEEAVLKMWEGLGYYSRARNLHAAAKEVAKEYNGDMPKDVTLLGNLKGIGPYTKGAISSIAYGYPEPAVDGNVMRVMSRILLIDDNISEQRTRKRMEHIIRDIIVEANPSSFNQGLMELGALICTPQKPSCLHCPVKESCLALATGETENLPVKLKKKKQRLEKYIVLLLTDENGNIAIEKRPDSGLLANMWQFPMIEKGLFEQGMRDESVWHPNYLDIQIGENLGEVKHIFSHIIWELEVYSATTTNSTDMHLYDFVAKDMLESFPFSVSHQKVRSYLDNPT